MLSFKRPKPGLHYALGSPIRLAKTSVPAVAKSLSAHPKPSERSKTETEHPINHSFPRSSMTKSKCLRAQEGSVAQQEVEVQRSASLWLQLPGCPAGLRRNPTDKEQPCAHVLTIYCASSGQSCSVISARNANSAQCSLYYHTAFWVFPQEAQGQ